MIFTTKTAILLLALGFLMMMPAGIASADTGCLPANAVTEANASPYWANYNDYLERLLTVEETFRNDNPCVTCRMRLEGVETSNGVLLESPMPREIGNLALSDSTRIEIKFRIPHGVGSFHSRARIVCVPATEPPVDPTPGDNQGSITVDPVFALANEGCPPEPFAYTGIRPIPIDTQYGPRRFIATLKDKEGNPVAGKTVKWSLSNNYDFRIMDSTSMTDNEGQVYAVITPPQYFICIIPYYSKGMTLVGASSDDGLRSESVFVFTRCAPPGSIPPWMKAPDVI